MTIRDVVDSQVYGLAQVLRELLADEHARQVAQLRPLLAKIRRLEIELQRRSQSNARRRFL
jgi:hypothetical protein